MPRPRIEVHGLGKSYGPVTALVNVSLTVAQGTVLGVLGHNGAGKSTLIDILATRTRPSAGTARVCGWDVVDNPRKVRRHIGMTSQFAALDEAATGRANLVLLARLLGASARQARVRADELIAVFDLAEVANRKVAGYSGGLRRRVDLAASLLGWPDVLFLDEPSTGLDPVSRTELWRFVGNLARGGTTVLLTTQYLEEADRLAGEIVVLAGGHVVASGTPERLKAGIGVRTATVRVPNAALARHAVAVLRRARLAATADEAACAVTVPIAVAGEAAGMVRTLDSAGIGILDITVVEPTLDDVYLALHRAANGTGTTAANSTRTTAANGTGARAANGTANGTGTTAASGPGTTAASGPGTIGARDAGGNRTAGRRVAGRVG